MGSCASQTVKDFSSIINKVDENDINAVRNLLVSMWALYDRLDKPSQKKLDAMANKINNVSP
jgi:hypothetical protein